MTTRPYTLYRRIAPRYLDPMTQSMQLEPGLRLVRAENSSPMTGNGTNTYLVGTKALAVIDPGPDDPAHLARLFKAIGTSTVACILVTHSHKDHSPLAATLSRTTGAPLLAFGDSRAGQSPLMQALAAKDGVGGGEGVDIAFSPDRCLSDGEVIAFDGSQIIAHWTPGHMGNHMCFQWGDAIFTGDHVMGWAPSLVSPPDGDMGAYMTSLERLAALSARILYSGHGAPINDPGARITELLAHRRAREAAILAELAHGTATIDSLTRTIYVNTAPALHKAAARNIFAHLVDLNHKSVVQANPTLSVQAEFSLPQSR